MAEKPSTKTITEPQREIEVCQEADVVVVGGGPGGIASALAAARNGADTILVERYGHLGGMATGGLVTIIPNLSNINGEQQIAGICQELIDRLDTKDATHYPRKEDWGSAEEGLVDFYVNANQFLFYIRDDLNTGKKRVLYTALVDPEILKCDGGHGRRQAGIFSRDTGYCFHQTISPFALDNCLWCYASGERTDSQRDRYELRYWRIQCGESGEFSYR